MLLDSPKTILITGGTSGIGLALLKQLHRRGDRLVVAARNETRLKEIEKEYQGVVTYACDLSSRSVIEELVHKVRSNHPDLTIIINNAAIQYTPTFIDDDFRFDSIEHEVAVNFLAPVWITALLLPHLMAQRGPSAIVNISSGLAFAPKRNSAVYCATKAAIHNVSQSLRYQLAESRVRVMEAIMPLVDTPMTAGRGARKMPPEEAARQIVQGMLSDKSEIYVGKARWLPLLMRLSPSLVKHIMARY